MCIINATNWYCIGLKYSILFFSLSWHDDAMRVFGRKCRFWVSAKGRFDFLLVPAAALLKPSMIQLENLLSINLHKAQLAYRHFQPFRGIHDFMQQSFTQNSRMSLQHFTIALKLRVLFTILNIFNHKQILVWNVYFSNLPK